MWLCVWLCVRVCVFLFGRSVCSHHRPSIRSYIHTSICTSVRTSVISSRSLISFDSTGGAFGDNVEELDDSAGMIMDALQVCVCVCVRACVCDVCGCVCARARARAWGGRDLCAQLCLLSCVY